MTSTELELRDVELTETSLAIPDGWEFDKWQNYGKRLARVSKSCTWWVGDWWRYGERQHYGNLEAAAATVGVEYQALANAGWVAGKVEFSRRRENLSWSHHAEIAALDAEDQDELLDKAEQLNLSVQALRSAVKQHRLRDKRQRSAELEERGGGAMPEGPFPILLADPPWRYDYAEDSGRAIENHYPTMDVEGIKALGPLIPAAEDAVLFLWATSPKLTEAIDVVTAWAFDYVTCAVWVKDRIGMGYYFRQQHELLLVGKRGQLPAPDPSSRASSLIHGDRLAHSAKPESAYELIEAMYPLYHRTDERSEFCELFCRTPRKGWRAWGNEV